MLLLIMCEDFCSRLALIGKPSKADSPPIGLTPFVKGQEEVHFCVTARVVFCPLCFRFRLEFESTHHSPLCSPTSLPWSPADGTALNVPNHMSNFLSVPLCMCVHMYILLVLSFKLIKKGKTNSVTNMWDFPFTISNSQTL